MYNYSLIRSVLKFNRTQIKAAIQETTALAKGDLVNTEELVDAVSTEDVKITLDSLPVAKEYVQNIRAAAEFATGIKQKEVSNG